MGKLNNVYLSLNWTLTKPFSLVQALGDRLIYSFWNAPDSTLFQWHIDILF